MSFNSKIKINSTKINIMRLMQSFALKNHIKELYILKELGLERPESLIQLVHDYKSNCYESLKEISYICRCFNCREPISYYIEKMWKRSEILIQKYYNASLLNICEECRHSSWGNSDNVNYKFITKSSNYVISIII
jgi:hypothetical protein